MPRFVFVVDYAEPLPTNAAMAGGGSITWLACGRQRLTDPFEVRGLCLILLLQHGPLLLSGILSPSQKEVVTKNTRESLVLVATSPVTRLYGHMPECARFNGQEGSTH